MPSVLDPHFPLGLSQTSSPASLPSASVEGSLELSPFSGAPSTLHASAPTCLLMPSARPLTFHNGHSSRPISTVIAHIPLTGFNVTHIQVAPATRQAPCLHWGRGKPWSSPTTCSLEGRQICKVLLREHSMLSAMREGFRGPAEEATSELCF